MKAPERLTTLFMVFFKISAVSVGGGLTMLPLIDREFVEKRQWLTSEEMVDIVAVMQSMPGIIAVNMGVLVGYRSAGIMGAVSAAIGVVIPPFVIIVIVAAFINTIKENKYIQDIFLGVRAAVCALILLSVIKLSRQIIKNSLTVIMALAAFIGLVVFQFNAIWMIIIAAAIGLAIGFFQLFKVRKKLEKANK